MTYKVTQLDDLPIMLIEISDPCDILEDSHATQDEVMRRFAEATRPFFIIYDIRKVTVTFEAVVAIIADAVYTPASHRCVFQNYGRILLVGAGPLMSLVTVSASRFLPTSGPARCFDTPEEALEYAHSQIVE